MSNIDIFFQIAEVVDKLYLWKESSDILDFLHGDSYLGKIAPETTTFGWAWPE